jgi:uncharacterized membrane protein YhfC
MQINWVLLFTYVIQIIIEIGLPVALAVWLIRKYQSTWMLVITGVAAYALSEFINTYALKGAQALFNNGTLPVPSTHWIPLLNGLIVGVFASLLENIMRWVGFKVNGKNSRPFRSSIALATGLGGIELAMVGILLAVNLYSVLSYNAGALLAKGVSADQVQATLSQITSYWSNPWYYGFLNLFEHLVTFVSQFVFAVMVWKAVSRAKPLWLLWSVLFQIVTEGIITFLSGMNWSLWQIEGVEFLLLLLNILLLYFFWTDEGGLDSENEDEESEESEGSDEDDDENEDDEEDDDEEDEEDSEDEEDEVDPEDK